MPEPTDNSEKALAFMGKRLKGLGPVLIPIALETVDFSALPDMNMPDIRPLYSAFRQLHRVGFRKFQIYNLSGTMTFSATYCLDDYQGRYQGRRCFVVGNGPSLNQLDMSRLSDEITLGANRCYLGYESWGVAFSYWGITDWLQIEVYGQEYEDNIPEETPKFVPFEYLPYLQMKNICPIPYGDRSKVQFLTTPERIGWGHSVTYMLLQVAALMGCDPIVLIGVDHRYPFHIDKLGFYRRHARERLIRPFRETMPYQLIQAWRRERRKVKPSQELPLSKYWVADDARGKTHFAEMYTSGENKRFLLPQPEEIRREHRCAARWARENGVPILNASPGSALDVFPMISYDSLF